MTWRYDAEYILVSESDGGRPKFELVYERVWPPYPNMCRPHLVLQALPAAGPVGSSAGLANRTNSHHTRRKKTRIENSAKYERIFARFPTHILCTCILYFTCVLLYY